MPQNLLLVFESLDFRPRNLQQVKTKTQPRMWLVVDSDFRPRSVVSTKMVVELS